MEIHPTTETDDDGWHLVSSSDWWRTPSDAVSWAYSSPKSPKNRCKAVYQPTTQLFPSTGSADWADVDEGDELGLNADLVGVRASCDVLSVYERNVGFHYRCDVEVEEGSQKLPDISSPIDEAAAAVHQERWNEMLQNLTGDFAEDPSPSTSSSISPFDSSDWEYPSHLSMPSTPKPKTSGSYGVSRSCNLSPLSSPSKLNASASSFTPSRLNVPSLTFSSDDDSPRTTASSPSPPLNDFVFPSLTNSRSSTYPNLKIEKDDQGFFTSVEAEEATPKSRVSPSSLLPAFLQEEHPRRKGSSSNTRAIVDRLRSTQSSTGSGGNGHSPSPSTSPVSFGQAATSADEAASTRSCSSSRLSTPAPSFVDDDGWIIGKDDHRGRTQLQAQRARELFLALSPRHQRSESGLGVMDLDDQNLSISPSPEDSVVSLSSASSSSSSSSLMPPTPTTITTNDGWIEVASATRGSALPIPSSEVQPKHKRRQSSTKKRSNSSSTGKVEPLTFPTLNAPPPGSGSGPTPRASRSRSRPSGNGIGPTSRAASVGTASSRTTQPPAATYYGGGYPPTVMPMPYPSYAMSPMLPYPGGPQYHLHQYAYSHPHQPPYNYQYQHQRARSVVMPPTYGPKPPYTVTHPMSATPAGMW